MLRSWPHQCADRRTSTKDSCRTVCRLWRGHSPGCQQRWSERASKGGRTSGWPGKRRRRQPGRRGKAAEPDARLPLLQQQPPCPASANAHSPVPSQVSLRHWHTPPWQSDKGGQAASQEPHAVGSVCRSTHRASGSMPHLARGGVQVSGTSRCRPGNLLPAAHSEAGMATPMCGKLKAL